MDNRPACGTVDPIGRIHFEGSNDECKAFLGVLGLACTARGWRGNGYAGLLEFVNGRHHAAAWKGDVEPVNQR